MKRITLLLILVITVYCSYGQTKRRSSTANAASSGNTSTINAQGPGHTVPAKASSSGNTLSSGNNQDIINTILANLSTDPDNPLKIDRETIGNIANAIPDGSLKSKLLTYSNNLGSDGNLSIRQVYWDLNDAFNKNSTIPSLSGYDKTSQGLNYLLNNSDELISNIKDKVDGYKPGVFMNDPYFISSLTEITGNANTAMALGAGAEIAMAFIQENKRMKKFKNEYPVYAQMSTSMVYPEIDSRLSKALIDGCVLKHPFNTVTPLYRYDLKNGASLWPENGILYFVNPSKGIKKALFDIEGRNDGKYESGKTGNAAGGSFAANMKAPNLLAIAANEGYIYLQTGKLDNDVNCKDCLKKGEDFIVNTETGETKPAKRLYYSINYDNIQHTAFTENSAKVANFIFPGSVMYDIDPITGKWDMQHFKIDKDKKLLLNNRTKKYSNLQEANEGSNSAAANYKHFFPFDMSNGITALIWGAGIDELPLFSSKDPDSTIYCSSFLQSTSYNKNGLVRAAYENEDGMINELTGLVINKDGTLFFTTAKGAAGKLDKNNWAYNDPKIADKIRQAAGAKKFDTYNFIATNNKYLFKGSGAQRYALPSLTLSPDEKWLVYIIRDKLYLIEANNLDNLKKFDLTITPYGHFFGRENDEPTLYLQAFNEFKIPIVKKYSFTKLINAPAEKPVVKKAVIESPKNTNSGSSSLAEEIKKLKVLLDEGTITKDEFEKAKAKLLEKN